MPAGRKYQLIRLRAGDYLLPANDGEQVWRIWSYEEYGDACWIGPDGEQIPIKGTFWLAARSKVPLTVLQEKDDEWILDHNNWEPWSTLLRTRREAIEEALTS